LKNIEVPDTRASDGIFSIPALVALIVISKLVGDGVSFSTSLPRAIANAAAMRLADKAIL
jgi:hypothetical protein